MSIVGDFDLNSMQGYAHSLKDVLKQTMLTQEVMFRKQVHELHRLYRTQKTLMDDSYWKELDGYNFWSVNTRSTLGPFRNPIQYSPLAKEESSYRSPKLGPTPSLNKDFLEENRSAYSRLQRGPSVLRLPTCQHVDHVGKDFSEKRYGWDLRKSLEPNHRFYDDNVSSSEEVKLTLSIGGETRIESGGKSTWHDKSTYSSCHRVVDLEESIDTISNEDSKYVKKDLPRWLMASCSLGDGSESCAGQKSFNQGFKERHVDIACNDMLNKEKPFAYKAFGLDLNKVQPDDSSSGAFDGIISSLFEDTSATIPTILWHDEASNPTFPNSINNSSKVCSSNATCEGICQKTEACPIDLESISGPLSETCDDLNSDYRKSESGNIDLLLKFSKENYTEDVIERCKEDTCRNGSRVEDANSNKSPSSGTDFEGSSIFHFDHFGKSRSSQIEETQSGEQDLRSSGSSEQKHQIHNKMKEEITRGEFLIQKAAKSLILFSLESSMRNQDCCDKVGFDNLGKDKPQRSLDSYERIVMKLKESNVDDDYCVSSKPIEVNEGDKRVSRNNWRRGRRMKDFQRDVLPSLASLSRQEICEDVNIMEAVIRSREYKRNRAKMGGGESWFSPVKSRKPRLNYVGRRYYS